MTSLHTYFVWQDQTDVLRGTEVSVLARMAWEADDKGAGIKLTIEQLAKELKVSKRSINMALKKLRDTKCIFLIKNTNKNKGFIKEANEYALNLDFFAIKNSMPVYNPSFALQRDEAFVAVRQCRPSDEEIIGTISNYNLGRTQTEQVPLTTLDIPKFLRFREEKDS